MRKLGITDIIFAAGLISALLFLGLQPREPNLPAYHYGERASTEYQTGGASCDPQILATIRNGRKATRERKRCAEAAEEHRLKSEDLIQQTRAANAAEAQAMLNYELARMALWGSIGGFLTLIAAAAAAYFARDAASASRETLGAFVALERPRVIASAMGTSGTDGKINVQLGTGNPGKSAATIHTIEYALVDTPDWPTTGMERITLSHPQAIHGDVGTCLLREIDAMSGGKVSPYVVGRLIYNSSFATDHYSYFGFHIKRVGKQKAITGWDANSFHKDADWPKDT